MKLLKTSKLGAELEGSKLVSYSKQLVNGINHLLVFEDSNGNRREVRVYESFNGQFEI